MYEWNEGICDGEMRLMDGERGVRGMYGREYGMS